MCEVLRAQTGCAASNPPVLLVLGFPALAIVLLVGIAAVVFLLNAVGVALFTQSVRQRWPTRQELLWLFSSWRNPLRVLLWAWMAYGAITIALGGASFLRGNTWVLALLALVASNVAPYVASLYQANIAVDRPAVFFDIAPIEGNAYELVVTNTCKHNVHDVKARVLAGDIGALSAPIIPILLGRGIASIKAGETRYPVQFARDVDATEGALKLEVSWQDVATVAMDVDTEGKYDGNRNPKRRDRISSVGLYEVQIQSKPDDAATPESAVMPMLAPSDDPSVLQLPVREKVAGTVPKNGHENGLG